LASDCVWVGGWAGTTDAWPAGAAVRVLVPSLNPPCSVLSMWVRACSCRSGARQCRGVKGREGRGEARQMETRGTECTTKARQSGKHTHATHPLSPASPGFRTNTGRKEGMTRRQMLLGLAWKDGERDGRWRGTIKGRHAPCLASKVWLPPRPGSCKRWVRRTCTTTTTFEGGETRAARANAEGLAAVA